MKTLTPDYFRTSKELDFWMSIYAEMLHEGTHQIFRTWIVKNWERLGDIKTRRIAKKYMKAEWYPKVDSEWVWYLLSL
jgi:hypothetical protein